MAQNKHYVYSARTTEKGLALLNKTKGDMSWDQFINDAVAAHYKLDSGIIALPPSKFLEEQKANRDAKAAEKAQRKADREAKAAAKKAEKAAAAKKGTKTGSTKADKKAADTKKGGKKGATKKGTKKAAKPAKVAATPAEETGAEETQS
jgi:hypothetical protein